MKRKREKIGTATYDLDELQELIVDGKYMITKTCRKEYSRIDYSEGAVIQVIMRLRKDEIFKTMPSEKVPDLMQDIYHTKEQNDELYIKLQKSKAGNDCVIIQFKLK